MGMQKIHIRASLLLLAFFLTGCSTTNTYWGGWSEWSDWEKTDEKQFSLSVDSNPSRATVYIDKKFVGTTPLTVTFPYPVLRSRSTRHKYEKHKPGLVEGIVADPLEAFLGPGIKSRTKKVDYEEKERFKEGTETYELMLKRKGCCPLVMRLNIPYSQTSISFTFKPKPLLKICKVVVDSKVELTFLEKLYEFFYENRFSTNWEGYDFERMILKSQLLNEVFNVCKGSKPVFTLGVRVHIEREHTLLKAQLFNSSNIVIVSDRLNFSTKDFNSVIETKLNTLVSNIANKFIKL